ncbi:DUF2568 domain-containing protein [Kitasatospora sp. NBC_01539]|uniref:DUF2568 domain-containing protein n=1 Tax=Kitasatospora sp. NBC_01539 TaxID=2903577 RepID=UPI00386028C4
MGVNLLVRFLLELCALAALAVGGWAAPGPVVVRALLAVVLPLAAALLWGRYAAPNAPVKSPAAWLLTQLLVLGGAVLALALAGHPLAAALLAGAAAVNTALLVALGRLRPPVRP